MTCHFLEVVTGPMSCFFLLIYLYTAFRVMALLQLSFIMPLAKMSGINVNLLRQIAGLILIGLVVCVMQQYYLYIGDYDGYNLWMR